jgi:transposase-like protein
MEASGMGLGEFAQQEDIGFTTLRRWRARLKRRRGGEQVSGGKSSAKFLTLPLTSRAATGLAEAQAAVEVRLEAGLTMRLYGPAGARLIEALVARIDAGRG